MKNTRKMGQNYKTLTNLDETIERVDKNTFMAPFNVINVIKSGFFLCQKGNLTIATDKSSYDMTAGDIYIYPPGTELFIKTWSEDIEGIFAVIGLDFITPVVAQISDTKRVLEILANPCISLTPSQNTKINQIADVLIERLDEESTPLHALLCKSLASALCYEISIALYSNKVKHPHPANRQDIIFMNFMLSLRKNLTEHRDVAFYANEQCLSPKHFSTVIKQRFGMSAGEWINIAVMAKAKELLCESQVSVKEIGFKLGFPNQSSFGRFFKQHSGVSPYKFRNSAMDE